MIIRNGTFLLGDALDVMRNIADDSIDLIATDPPYRTISGGTSGGVRYGWNSSVVSKNDGRIFAHNDIAIADYLPSLFRILKPGGHAYVMINNLNLRDMLNCADAIGFGFHNLLVWEKNTATANRWYMKNLEYTVLLYKRPARRIRNAGSKQTFRFDNPRNKRHPTEKPPELLQHYIENSSDPGDVVFDPFAGSGSTAIAAEQSARRWLCVERDPEYYWPAVARLIDHACDALTSASPSATVNSPITLGASQ